jgi:hypothetical protein
LDFDDAGAGKIQQSGMPNDKNAHPVIATMFVSHPDK